MNDSNVNDPLYGQSDKFPVEDRDKFNSATNVGGDTIAGSDLIAGPKKMGDTLDTSIDRAAERKLTEGSTGGWSS